MQSSMILISWSQHSSMPLLAVIQLLPVLALIIAYLLRHHRLLAPVSITLAILQLIPAVMLYTLFDLKQPGLQFVEQIRLLGPLAYRAGVDGAGVLFILVTTVLSVLLIIYGRIRQLEPASRFIPLIFAITASLYSMFASFDLLWFGLMSIIQLLLVSRVFKRWAIFMAEDSAQRRFMQFMGSSLLLLFAGLFLLGWHHADMHAGTWTFSLYELSTDNIRGKLASIIFFLLFFAMAIRIPIFPMHGWLPFLAEHGTVAVVGVLLLGIKAGFFGLYRFVLPLLPESALQFQPLVVTLAVTGIFYAAVLAMLQINLRSLLAFAVISHSSLLIVGLFTLSHNGIVGSIVLSISFGLAITSMLFMTGLVYPRTRTLLLSRMGGLFDQIPFIGIVFFVAGLNLIGMPGTPGFDAVHLMFEDAIVHFGALTTIAAAVGNVLAAGFLLWAFQRAFLAPLPGDAEMEIAGVSRSEFFLGGLMLLILLGTGFYLEPWLQLIDSGALQLSSKFSVTQH